ncbi:hypothetical protein EGH24_12415 [Halonotius terrestris]|uniref:Uncharacterized protein n=1 Tax=Halonotius terrestris TaxID=2487750 RepID=A0A8J8PB78_9EURY|nr:hypothetical protein [Halonotius terrestris]TQQ79188.1 hypothetical protein EGH24_12415 [Halonotius terrestris]
MRDFGDVEAVRISLNSGIKRDGKTSVQMPQDRWNAAIIRESQQLCQFVQTTVEQAIETYYDQLNIEANSDGRVVAIRHPVRLSGGVLDTIRLLEEIEPILDQYVDSHEQYAEIASFSAADIYEEVAKEGLNFCTTIIPRVRLFAHTYLWILWTHESLRQANRFAGLLMGEHDFEQFSESAFPYIAHPPLIVATIACSTMIEEVGANYINAYVAAESYDLDETSPRQVLKDIEEHYPESGDYDTTKIDELVIDARNDISHYVTGRGETITLRDFEEFYQAVGEGMRLVNSMLLNLIQPPIVEFRASLDKLLT